MFIFFLVNRAVWDNVGRCATAGQTTDDNVTRRMRIARWIPKATNTHSEHVTFIAVPVKNGYTNRLNVSYKYTDDLVYLGSILWKWLESNRELVK